MYRKSLLMAGALSLLTLSGVAMATSSAVNLTASIPNGSGVDSHFLDKTYNFSYCNPTAGSSGPCTPVISIGTIKEDVNGNIIQNRLSPLTNIQNPNVGVIIMVDVSNGTHAVQDSFTGNYHSWQSIAPSGNTLAVTFDPISSPDLWTKFS